MSRATWRDDGVGMGEALPGPDAGAAPMAAFLSGRQDRSAAFQDGKKAVRNPAGMMPRPLLGFQSRHSLQKGHSCSRDTRPSTLCVTRPVQSRHSSLPTSTVMFASTLDPKASGSSRPHLYGRLIGNALARRVAGILASLRLSGRWARAMGPPSQRQRGSAGRPHSLGCPRCRVTSCESRPPMASPPAPENATMTGICRSTRCRRTGSEVSRQGSSRARRRVRSVVSSDGSD